MKKLQHWTMTRNISFALQQLWFLLCCTNLLHHRLGYRPQLGGFLKLLLLHGLLYCLCCTVDIVQAIIIQQWLHSKETKSQHTSLLPKSFKHLNSNICLLFVTYSSVEVWSPRHDRVCGWSTCLTVSSLVSSTPRKWRLTLQPLLLKPINIVFYFSCIGLWLASVPTHAASQGALQISTVYNTLNS